MAVQNLLTTSDIAVEGAHGSEFNARRVVHSPDSSNAMYLDLGVIGSNVFRDIYSWGNGGDQFHVEAAGSSEAPEAQTASETQETGRAR
jgi:hypothetical protein